MELNEVIKTAYETSLEVANSYITAADKQAAAELIGELRDHALAIGNSQSGDKYIFGGYSSAKAPFTIDTATGKILYNGLDLSDASSPALIAEDTQVIQYEIGFGLKADVSLPGTGLMGMGEDNIYAVLDGLYNALQSDASAAQISVYVTRLQKAQGEVMALTADIGGRASRLELVENRHEEDFFNYTEMKSNVEDADMAEVIMKYKMAEAVYQAALQIGARIIQPTLVDYLD